MTRIRRLAPPDVEQVASWLAAEENYRWPDFGQGVQALSAVSLKIMVQTVAGEPCDRIVFDILAEEASAVRERAVEAPSGQPDA